MKGDLARRSPGRSLLVTHKERWNGETEYAACLIEAEISLGYRVTLIAPEYCELVRRLRNRVEFYPLPGLRPSRSPLDFMRDLLFISRLLESGKFDLVHSCRATSHLMTALAARRRVPFLHLRSGAKQPRNQPANRFLYRVLTGGVIVSSTRINNWLVKHLGMDPARVHRILAPVDTDYFRPLPPDSSVREELGIPNRGPLLVNLARLAPIKGHPVLLEAMALVRREFPEARLLLVGFPWRGQPGLLRRQARELGIADAVFFTGHREDTLRLISPAEVCVSSSLGSEENSRAVTEYMACGKPVVATRVGVIPELVADGGTGVLVEPNDPASLAEGLKKILRDPALSRRMGEAGRERAERELSFAGFQEHLSEILPGAGKES